MWVGILTANTPFPLFSRLLCSTQAKQLKEAGVTAYNHNLDSSREFYSKVLLE